jgi:hypothetical protein
VTHYHCTMIVYGGGSCTAHYATYRSRARLPTPPRDDGLKDEELSNRNSNSNHEFHNSNREPALPTPPGSAKTSIDLPTKSSHKLLTNDGQNVLDLVKDFIEIKPADSLVTQTTLLQRWNHFTNKSQLSFPLLNRNSTTSVRKLFKTCIWMRFRG